MCSPHFSLTAREKCGKPETRIPKSETDGDRQYGRYETMCAAMGTCEMGRVNKALMVGRLH